MDKNVHSKPRPAPSIGALAGADLKERVKDLRQTVLRMPSISLERARLLTDSYKETKAEPPLIRRALGLAKILDNMTVYIGEGELIVGNVTGKIRGGEILPEINAQWMLDELDEFATREWDRFEPLTEDEKIEIKEILSSWEGDSLYEMWRTRMPAEKLPYLTNGVSAGHVMAFNGHYLTHNACDYEMVLTKGLRGVREEAEKELAGLDMADPANIGKHAFLRRRSSRSTPPAALPRGMRTWRASLAAGEKDPQRKAELELIAETCAQVPAGPARTFFEALQAMCFVWTIITIEGNGLRSEFRPGGSIPLPVLQERHGGGAADRRRSPLADRFALHQGERSGDHH